MRGGKGALKSRPPLNSQSGGFLGPKRPKRPPHSAWWDAAATPIATGGKKAMVGTKRVPIVKDSSTAEAGLHCPGRRGG